MMTTEDRPKYEAQLRRHRTALAELLDQQRRLRAEGAHVRADRINVSIESHARKITKYTAMLGEAELVRTDDAE